MEGAHRRRRRAGVTQSPAKADWSVEGGIQDECCIYSISEWSEGSAIREYTSERGGMSSRPRCSHCVTRALVF